VSLPPVLQGGVRSQVDCPASTGCIATFSTFPALTAGTLVAFREHRGKWSREAILPGIGVHALACPAVGSCVAAGLGSEGSLATVVTQRGRSWRASVVQLPGNPSPSFPVLPSVSCGSAGVCTAVGWYQVFNPGNIRNHALLVNQDDGTWSAGSDAPLPPDAATTSDPDGFVLGGGALSVVTCPSAGDCVALGSYGETVAGQHGPVWLSEPWVTTERAGQWQPGVKVQLPADANPVSYHENDPFIGFTGVSCPSDGNCTAIGGYSTGGAEVGLILIERNGVWSPPIRAPQPGGHQPPNWPNELDNPLVAVSCPDRNDCAAIGVLGGYSAGPWLGWLLSERHGTWKASTATVALPGGKVGIPANLFLNSVTCPSAGNCVAVGTYHNGKYGLIEVERNGKWQPGIRPVVPRDAARKKGWTNLDVVSCPSTNRCTIVGSYNNRSGRPTGLILNLRFR
jgi:hypothetical protein